MSNTRRYMTLFAEAADDLLPAPSVQQTEEDVFDVLMRQVPVHVASPRPGAVSGDTL